MAAGTSNNADSPSPAAKLVFAAGRLLAFILLAGTAVATLAAVVLLPAYARMERVRYERDCLKTYNTDVEQLIGAYSRLIAALPEDDVLTLRLARSYQDLLPRNALVLTPENRRTPATPDVIDPVRTPPPPPPNDWMTRAAEKLQNERKKRGMLLLAGGAMLTAMFCFSGVARTRRPDPQ